MTLRYLAMLALAVLIVSDDLRGVEIEGRIAESADGLVTITIDSGTLPRVGDKVQFFAKLPGIDDLALSGDGTITEVGKGRIRAKVENSTVTIEKGQIARIRSTSPAVKVADAPPAVVDRPVQPAPPAETPATGPETVLSGKQIYRQMLRGSAWIFVPSDPTHAVTGTGWLLDVQRKLLITNHHVIASGGAPLVFFPVIQDGRANTDREFYLKKVKGIKGTVFLSNPIKDLAVIQLESLPPEVTPLTLASESASPGDMLYSIGNPGPQTNPLWIFTTGTARQATHLRAYYDATQFVDVDMLEAQSPINHGDSGGPVLDEDGQLVAVVSSHRQNVDLINNFIDVSEVRKFVGEVDDIYAPRTAAQFYHRGMCYKAIGRWDEAIAGFSGAIRLDSKNADAFAEQGLCFVEKKDYDTATVDFDAAIRIDPQCAMAFHARAKMKLNRRLWQDAIRDASEAIRINPKDAASYNNRAVAYGNLKQQDLALTDYQRSVVLNPLDAVVQTNLGRLLTRRGDADGAMTHFVAAVNANCHYEPAFEALADLCVNQKKDPTKAINLLTADIKANPGNSDALLTRAKVLYHVNWLVPALLDLEAALKINPDLAAAYDCRGSIRLDLRSLPSAQADLTQAIKLAPNVPLYHLNMGDYRREVGDLKGAVAEYTRAVELFPKYADAHVRRAVAHRSLGNEAEAGEDLRLAKEIDSTLADVQIAKHFTRYLRVTNGTPEALQVSFQYLTKNTGGDWQWYPAAPPDNHVVNLSIAPNTTTEIKYENVLVHGKTFRIWAPALGDLPTNHYKDVDLKVCPEDGYYDTAASVYDIIFLK